MMEKNTILFFSVVVLISAIMTLLFQENHNVTAIILMVVGVFGVFRFYDFLHLKNPAIPKNLSLSSRILFGLQDKKRINFFFNQMSRVGLIVTIFLTTLFLIWAIYCSFNPANIPVLDFFWQQKYKTYDGLNLDIHKSYSIIFRLSEWLIPILFFIISMTISLPHKMNLFVAMLGVILMSLTLYVNDLILLNDYTNYTYLKGLGLGSYNNFMMLINREEVSQPQSFFMRRYIETGLIGAYGLYVIFVPIAFIFIKPLIKKGETAVALFALFILGALWVFDFFYALSLYALSIQIIIFSILGVLFSSQLYRQNDNP